MFISSSENNISSIGSVGAPPGQSEIEKQFILCEKQKNCLMSVIEILETRLSPILRKPVGEENVTNEKEQHELIPLADNIHKISRDVIFFTKKIESIIYRLEI